MGINFNALGDEAKRAVEWKAKQNLSLALADGNERTLANQQKFIENNCENLATNADVVQYIVKEYRDNAASDD